MSIKRTLALAACIASLGTTTAFAGDTASHSKAATKELSAASREGAQKMLKMKSTGDLDHDFLMMMKQHHQDGIKMAQIAVEHSTDEKVKQKAQQIIEMQQKDIAEFDQVMQAHHAAQGTGGSPQSK